VILSPGTEGLRTHGHFQHSAVQPEVLTVPRAAYGPRGRRAKASDLTQQPAYGVANAIYLPFRNHENHENILRMSVMFFYVTAVMILVSPVNATMRITADRGGLVVDYVELFEAARSSGEQVIIDGACLSACTLAIGILPRGQVCATPKAALGFHAAWRATVHSTQVTSPIMTQVMYEAYPANVRDWIAHHGGLTSRLIILKGRELAALVPACGSSLSGAAHRAR
jgi:hypothetical protein